MSNIQDIKVKATRLDEIRKLKAQFEKEEKAIKDELKSFLGEEKSAILGNIMIIVSIRNRTDLDKDKVRELLGDKYADCEKTSEYQIMEVKCV